MNGARDFRTIEIREYIVIPVQDGDFDQMISLVSLGALANCASFDTYDEAEEYAHSDENPEDCFEILRLRLIEGGGDVTPDDDEDDSEIEAAEWGL